MTYVRLLCRRLISSKSVPKLTWFVPLPLPSLAVAAAAAATSRGGGLLVCVFFRVGCLQKTKEREWWLSRVSASPSGKPLWSSTCPHETTYLSAGWVRVKVRVTEAFRTAGGGGCSMGYSKPSVNRPCVAVAGTFGQVWPERREALCLVKDLSWNAYLLAYTSRRFFCRAMLFTCSAFRTLT